MLIGFRIFTLMMRGILKRLLRWFSKGILQKYHPDIIAITGSIGKTSTKDAVASILLNKFSVRKTEKNYNTQIGVPFAIIGATTPNRDGVGWFWVFFKACLLLIVPGKRAYPQILILELAADRPGDIEHFMSFIPPTMSIITSVSPVHLEQFTKFSRIVAEKRKVIEALSPEGYAVLNYDDKVVQQMAGKTKGRIFSYAVDSKEVHLKAEEVKVMVKDGEVGLFLKLLYQGTVTPIFIRGVGLKEQVYSALAGAAVGLIYGLTPFEVAQGIEGFEIATGRFNVKKCHGDAFVIDDTYNAAPASAIAALKSLVELPIGDRKVAILGDMLEFGSYEREAHEQVGAAVAELKVALLITYGERGKLIQRSAGRHGIAQRCLAHFDDIDDLVLYAQSIKRAGDVILVKGSRGMRMERIVVALCSSH